LVAVDFSLLRGVDSQASSLHLRFEQQFNPQLIFHRFPRFRRNMYRFFGFRILPRISIHQNCLPCSIFADPTTSARLSCPRRFLRRIGLICLGKGGWWGKGGMGGRKKNEW